MAAPTLTRISWIAVALLAAAVIVALAAHGHRPDSSFARFQAAGVMVEVAPEHVTEVVVSRHGRRWQFARAEGRGWTADTTPLGGDLAARLDSGLRFLHVSAPQRILARAELSETPLAELGLDPPRYAVSVKAGGAIFAVEFGALNAQGLAQYAHVAGKDDIVLLPSFVGEPWDALTAGR